MMSALELFLALAATLMAGVAIGYYNQPGAARWNQRMREQADSFNAYHIDAKDRIRAANQRATALETEAAALRADHAEAEQTIAALRRGAAATAAAPTESGHITTMVIDKTVVSEIGHEPEAALAEPEQILVAPEPVAEAEYDAPEAEAEVLQPPEPPIVTAFEVPETLAEPSAVAASGGDDLTTPAAPEATAKGWFGSRMRDDLTRIRGIDALLDTRLFSLGVLRFKDITRWSDEDEMALEQRLALPVGFIAREQWRAQAALLRAGKHVEHADYFSTPVAATTE